MFAFLDPILIHIHNALAVLDGWIPAALVVVLVTVAIRLALHPMNRRMQRGTVRRRDLQPRLNVLREEHREDPAAMQKATMDLYRGEGVSPLPGCLPILIQIPIFSMIYRLFTAPEIAGQHNQLLDHTLFGTPLSAHLLTTAADQRWIFFVLIAITLVVAAFAARQMRRHMAQDKEALAAATAAISTSSKQAKPLSEQQKILQDSMEQMTKFLPLMSFFTVIAVFSLPLAAGLYLVTSSSWGLLERASLRRIQPRPAAGTRPDPG